MYDNDSRVILGKNLSENIKSYLKQFKEYLKTEEYKNFRGEINKNIDLIQKKIPEVLDELSEEIFNHLISSLWASQMWGNKELHTQKIIKENGGLDNVGKKLKIILDKSKTPGKRLEYALKNFKFVGPATVTEIMTYNEPDRCSIWNRRSRKALKFLGFDDVIKVNKSNLSAREYDAVNLVISKIGKELEKENIITFAREVGISKIDNLFVDNFLYYVSSINDKKEIIESSPYYFDHNEIKQIVADIGSHLGFDVDMELLIARGSKVDVVWRAKIGNLGLVTYVFEVHKSGSIDSLLVNLMKSINNPTVHKVVAISDETQLDKIEKMAEGLPEKFRQLFTTWDVREVREVWENLTKVNSIVSKLGLTKDPFSES